jgi:hypothetical protein
MSKDFRLGQLIEALRLLAADYETQVNSLPAYVHVPDEVALIFDDSWLLVEQNLETSHLNPKQIAQLQEIDHLLEQMGGRRDIWTLHSLKTSAQWEAVRISARMVLQSMDQEIVPPNLNHTQYIR